MRKILYSTLLFGVALPKGPRRGSSIRLQTTSLQDVRVRGLRSHDIRARGPLPPLEGEPPVQPGTPQVLRQAPFQVQQLQFRQHAFAGQLLKKKMNEHLYTKKQYD